MTGREAADIRERLGLTHYQMGLVLGVPNGGKVESIERSNRLSRPRADSYRLVQISAGLLPVSDVCRHVLHLIGLAKLKRGKGRPRKMEPAQKDNHA